jgi:hypothetical protein
MHSPFKFPQYLAFYKSSPFPPATENKKDSSPVALEQTAGRETSSSLYVLAL